MTVVQSSCHLFLKFSGGILGHRFGFCWHGVQVGAHGTGAAIPPVDEQVVSMKLVTPAQGTLELSMVRGGQGQL